ncbi:MAG TPA: hypothetical protein PKE55_00335 [Kiritimatiellia bacterium]|nr:hypothetical protein [Kiritimatiellia bacterium]
MRVYTLWRDLSFAGVAAIMVFMYVHLFGVNVPIHDDWDLVQTHLGWIEQGLTLESLFALHNEHCIATSRLWSHAVLRLSGGNYKLLLFSNALLHVVFVVLLIRFVGSWRLPLYVHVSLCGALALLTMSWSQWQNFLWSIQTPFFSMPLLLMVGVWMLIRCKSDAWAFGVAIVVGWICIVSNGNGLFVAVGMVPSVLLRWRYVRGPATIRWVVLYLLNQAMLLMVMAHFLTNRPSLGYGGIDVLLRQPLQALYTLLVILGSPADSVGMFLGVHGWAAMAGVIGMMLAVIFMYVFIRSPASPMKMEVSAGLALLLYGGLSVLAVVYSRVALIAASGVESRYQSFAILWWIGLLMLGAGVTRLGVPRVRVSMAAITVLASLFMGALTLRAMPFFWVHGNNMRDAHQQHQMIYRSAHDPEWRTAFEQLGHHYAPEQIADYLVRMRAAGFLHPDLWPSDPPQPESER